MDMVGKDCILAKCKENSCTVVDHWWCYGGRWERYLYADEDTCHNDDTGTPTPYLPMPLASRFLEYLLPLYLCQISFFSKLFE